MKILTPSWWSLGKLVTLAAGLVGIGICIGAPIAPSQANNALGIGVFILTCWIWRSFEEAKVALIFMALAMLFDVAPPSVVFSGFTSSASWMVLAGLILSLAMEFCGLLHRLARLLSYRIHGSYPRIIASICILGVLTAFLIPSGMTRVILLTPLIATLANRLGFPTGSKGYQGIILAAIFSTFLTGFSILPANVPNLVFASVSEALHGYTPIYGVYLLLHFPVLGLLRVMMIGLLIVALYSEPPHHDPESVHLRDPWRYHPLDLLMLIGLGLWMTDFWHRMAPAWIGLGLAVICLISRLTPEDTLRHRLDLRPFFNTAGIVGFGAVISHTGLGNQIATVALQVLPLAGSPISSQFAMLVGLALMIGILTNQPGVPTILVPIATSLAEQSDLPLATVMMTQVIGFATIVFPYQGPPLLVGARLGGIPLQTVAYLCLGLAALTCLVIIPIDFWWWTVLGWVQGCNTSSCP